MKNTYFSYLRLITVTFIIAMNSCISDPNTKEIEVFSMTPILTTDELRGCKKRVIEYGDTEAYDSLVYHYFFPDILPWALIMANKYYYMEATSHVFTCMETLSPTKTIEGLDEVSRQQALDYLKLSVERGDFYSAETLAKYYYEGKYLREDKSEANRLMKIYQEGKQQVVIDR